MVNKVLFLINFLFIRVNFYFLLDSTTDLSSCQSNIRTRDMEGGVEITTYEEACNIIKNCSVIIGMHPDQVI